MLLRFAVGLPQTQGILREHTPGIHEMSPIRGALYARERRDAFCG